MNCIESKTAAHGRRQDQVMCIGRRVKKRDFLQLVNYYRLQRNKKPIKSATTVCNRGRPQNKGSIQAKRHLGMGLFCTKKPPKAEANDNELTHYQRAHKKNVVHHFYAMERKEGDAFVCEMSIDDKAYLCPATSTGMRGAKNQKIFQTCDEIKARKLPKYDFPVSMVNVTPATHRFMTKQLRNVDGKNETEIVDDVCYVFARPKFFQGSSGRTWASEFMHIRIEEPHKFEINSHDSCSVPETSKASKSIYIIIKDSLSYYMDSSHKDDILNLGSSAYYDYKGYQINRNNIILRLLWSVFKTFYYSPGNTESGGN